SEVMNIIGEVKGFSCVMVDDIVDTAGTLVSAAEALLAAGAKEVAAYVAHGVLSGPAVSRIEKSGLVSLVVTDSIAASAAVNASKKIRVAPIAPLMGEAIKRISLETSVSSLFD
ncbi:MAG TPA: phosphoribosyltransferase family protein, partial [Sphingomonadales bacterium]|nr:phosphoribosyltransferase family protein [Sphingomonadales bacterium]